MNTSPNPQSAKDTSYFDNSRCLRRRRKPARWLSLAGLWLCLAVLCAGLAFIVERAGAQVPAPGMKVSLLSTNQVQIVITNGSSSANYEIYRTAILGDDQNYPFTLYLTGSLAQTSFVASFGIDTRGYFRAAVGSDWHL